MIKFTPSHHSSFDHKLQYVSIKDSDDDQVSMKPLDSNPCDRREHEVVDECRQDGTRYPLDLGILEIRVESDDGQEGGV